jgi:hypothetical protein
MPSAVRLKEFDLSKAGRDTSDERMSENECEMHDERLWFSFSEKTNKNPPT